MTGASSSSCIVCETIPVKYPCKQCRAPTCSLACFKLHQAACDDMVPSAESLAQSSAILAISDNGVLAPEAKGSTSGPAQPQAVNDNPEVSISAEAFAALCKENPGLRARLAEHYSMLSHAREPSTPARETQSIEADVAWELQRAHEAAEVRGAQSKATSMQGNDRGMAAFVQAVKAQLDGNASAA